ncbi:flagellar basal-body protein FlbY, partial [Salmonella sp. gx-f5]|nr:flagellar basal-body protein FlbY [Salmonella sp. gx-f5]
MSDSELAQARMRQLIVLTKRLTDRLSAETQAFADRRPQDVAAGLAETQEMANLYRRDTAHVKANPALLRDAPLDD